jgi:signal transduction histidine kinase
MFVKDDKLSLPFLNRLTTRIVIAMVAFLFSLTLLVIFLVDAGFRRSQNNAYAASQQALEEQIKTSIIQSTSVELSLLENHLHEANRLVSHLTSFLEYRLEMFGADRIDPDGLQPLFEQLLAQNSDLAALFYISPSGEEIRIVSGNTALADLAINFQSEYVTGDLQWQVIGDAEANTAVIVYKAVYNHETASGIAGAVFSASHLADHLQELVTVPGGYAFIVNSEGETLASTTPGIHADIHAQVARGATAPMHAISMNLDGLPVLLVPAALKEPNWSVAVVAPLSGIEVQSGNIADEAWITAEQTIRSTLVQVFLFLFGGILVTLIFLIKVFNQRISSLIDQVQAVAQGDFSITIQENTSDEFGLLAHSINRMSGEIQRHRSELLTANAELQRSEELYRNLAHDLEDRVEESTRETQRLYEQASTRRQELEVLYQADEHLYRHLRLDQVLQALVDVVVDQLKAEKCGVQVWDEDQQRLVLRASKGFSLAAMARINNYQPGDGIAGRVFATGEIVTMEDATLAPPPANEIAAAENIRSVISVPIKIKDRIFGVFGMNYCHVRTFSASDIRLFNALAQRAAIAIQNAHLYEQAEQAATLEERQRLARELHDAITQSLYSLVLLAEAGRRYMNAGNQEQVQHHLGRMGETAQQALKEMRLLVYELRPPALTNTGLSGAIRHRLNAVEKRAGMKVRFIEEGVIDLPPGVEEQVYRLVQEALNNTLKHANAQNISIVLRQIPQQFELELQDDGQGFCVEEANTGGIGLASMHERAERIMAALEIDSTPGKGTVIRVRLPLNQKEEA